MNEERLIDLRIRALELAMQTPLQGSILNQRPPTEQRTDIAQGYLDFLCNAGPMRAAPAT